jgi:hypothetical protein
MIAAALGCIFFPLLEGDEMGDCEEVEEGMSVVEVELEASDALAGAGNEASLGRGNNGVSLFDERRTSGDNGGEGVSSATGVGAGAGAGAGAAAASRRGLQNTEKIEDADMLRD